MGRKRGSFFDQFDIDTSLPKSHHAFSSTPSRYGLYDSQINRDMTNNKQRWINPCDIDLNRDTGRVPTKKTSNT
jgi:hypothetical protein